MLQSLVELLRCPVTRSRLTIVTIKEAKKELDGQIVDIIAEGILYADKDWFYPVINGVPRLMVESIIDYEGFLCKNISNFKELKRNIFSKYADLINLVYKKNYRTKQSFTQEWALFNPEKDKTWNADEQKMLERFFTETSETKSSLQNKIVFDAGCGNGLLNSLLAKNEITNIAMDFSNSIEGAYNKNKFSRVHFIQGDIQYPPLLFNYFDVVHCSGVLIHTNNTELSFSCIEPLVKSTGKLSVWLYHHRNYFTHKLFNEIRKITCRWPLKMQYYIYRFTIFPISYVIKRIKGNQQNSREMMIDILDWFTPEFRWEHSHDEVAAWFYKRQYKNVKVTTNGVFGFNIIGIKNK